MCIVVYPNVAMHEMDKTQAETESKARASWLSNMIVVVMLVVQLRKLLKQPLLLTFSNTRPGIRNMKDGNRSVQ